MKSSQRLWSRKHTPQGHGAYHPSMAAQLALVMCWQELPEVQQKYMKMSCIWCRKALCISTGKRSWIGSSSAEGEVLGNNKWALESKDANYKLGCISKVYTSIIIPLHFTPRPYLEYRPWVFSSLTDIMKKPVSSWM